MKKRGKEREEGGELGGGRGRGGGGVGGRGGRREGMGRRELRRKTIIHLYFHYMLFSSLCTADSRVLSDAR